MAAHFPTLSCGNVLRYPATHGVEIPTGVIQFEDDSEQRWVRSPTLHQWSLVFSDLSEADLATIETFWLACKGAFDATWDITIGNTTYSYCTFLDDEFTPTETARGRFSLTLQVRQVRKN